MVKLQVRRKISFSTVGLYYPLCESYGSKIDNDLFEYVQNPTVPSIINKSTI